MPADSTPWPRLREQAAAAGLNLAWAVPRAAIDPLFATPARQSRSARTPATLHPGYRCALVLGSAGPALWRGLRATLGAVPDPAADPIDRHSERTVETLATALHATDPSLVSVYPFRHARQLLGFPRLLGSAPWLERAPFGVIIEPQAGPWWALRGALLTVLAVPPSAPAGESPCTPCPAPCEAACPAGAVHKSGFDWRACADFRLAPHSPCRSTCLARLACPVGPAFRYDAAAIAHHYTASLRELEAARGGNR